MLLMDKVCIIAGAASLRSIGYATAELFIEHGAKVVVTDVCMNEDVLRSIKASIEKQLVFLNEGGTEMILEMVGME